MVPNQTPEVVVDAPSLPVVDGKFGYGLTVTPIAVKPGDPERKTRAERTRNRVPLPDDTWAAIVNTAREVGVSEVSIQRATS